MTIDQARRLKILARWHRRVALVVCAWLAVLAASGLLINHAHDWALDRTPLAASMQRLLYGIERDGLNFCERDGVLGPECVEVFAALPLPGGELLLGRNVMFLLDAQGGLVERLAPAQLGLGALEAGLLDGSDLYLRDSEQVVRADLDLLDWQILEEAAAVSARQRRDWAVRGGPGETISWERLLLDLHAARFLGPLAKFFTDLMAALILLLALSGLWLWWLKGKRE